MQQAGIHVVFRRAARWPPPRAVELHDGTGRAAPRICTIGTTAPLLVHRLDVPKEGGRLLTDPDLRVNGHRTSGQSATAPTSSMPMTARSHPRPASLPNGKGSKRRRTSFGSSHGQSTKPFSYRPLGQLCAASASATRWLKLGCALSGFPAWWLWRTVYLLKSPSWSRRVSGVRLDLGAVLPARPGPSSASTKPNGLRGLTIAPATGSLSKASRRCSFYVIERARSKSYDVTPRDNSTWWRGWGRESFSEKWHSRRHGPYRQRPGPHGGRGVGDGQRGLFHNFPGRWRRSAISSRRRCGGGDPD